MMALYRSLVYRELKLTRKHYFLYLVLYSLMGLLFMLPLVLSGEGSFDKKSGLSYETGKSIIQMFAVLLALLGAVTSGSTNNVQKMDINSGWKRYSYTLPLTAGEKAMSDFLLKILVFLLFGVLSSVFVLGISYGSGYDVMCFVLNMYLIMSAEIWLIDAIESGAVVIGLNSSVVKSVLITIILLTAIFPVFGINLFTGKITNVSTGAEYSVFDLAERSSTLIFSIPFFVVVCIGYYLIMRKAYERREA